MPAASNDATVLLRIRPPMPDPEQVGAARGPLTMESVLASLHSLRRSDTLVSLELGMAEGKIALYTRVRLGAAPLLESQLYAQYPDAEIEVVDEELFTPKEGEAIFARELVLTDP